MCASVFDSCGRHGSAAARGAGPRGRRGQRPQGASWEGTWQVVLALWDLANPQTAFIEAVGRPRPSGNASHDDAGV
jgi:hypothetical protein